VDGKNNANENEFATQVGSAVASLPRPPTIQCWAISVHMFGVIRGHVDPPRGMEKITQTKMAFTKRATTPQH